MLTGELYVQDFKRYPWCHKGCVCTHVWLDRWIYYPLKASTMSVNRREMCDKASINEAGLIHNIRVKTAGFISTLTNLKRRLNRDAGVSPQRKLAALICLLYARNLGSEQLKQNNGSLQQVVMENSSPRYLAGPENNVCLKEIERKITALGFLTEHLYELELDNNASRDLSAELTRVFGNYVVTGEQIGKVIDLLNEMLSDGDPAPLVDLESISTVTPVATQDCSSVFNQADNDVSELCTVKSSASELLRFLPKRDNDPIAAALLIVNRLSVGPALEGNPAVIAESADVVGAKDQAAPASGDNKRFRPTQ